MINYIAQSIISIILVEYLSIGLWSLANWTFGVALQPFHDALLMVKMFASQFNDLLGLLELAITNSAEILLLGLRLLEGSLVLLLLKVFYLLFC